MKKFGKIALVGVFALSLTSIVSAADLKVSGKVDALVLESVPYLDGAKTKTALTAGTQLFNALLTVKSNVSDKVSAQVSTNLAGAAKSGQENNTSAENFVAVKLGAVDLKAGSFKLSGLKNTNTIYNNDVLANKLNLAMTQVAVNGDAGAVKYGVSLYQGSNDDKGKPTNDAVINITADKLVDKLSASLVYYLDMVTKNEDIDPNTLGNQSGESKESMLGLGVSYEVAGATIDAQFLSFDKTRGAKLAGDTSDITSEIVVCASYKVNESLNAGLAYDIYGKANNIALTAAYEVAKPATLKVRIDVPGSKYKDAQGTDTIIGVSLGTEF
ncbi:hypothetical protein HZA55_10580 [Candidatus Poribacteria bacterium]|nr:hypothetical protein [Candidatus Poribacteria bacterium]